MLVTALLLAAAPYEQWGFTGNIGSTIPFEWGEGVGVRTSLGARYGMLPPPDADFQAGINHPPAGVYVTPAVSFLATGSFTSATLRDPAPSRPSQPLQPATATRHASDRGSAGGAVRLELDVARRGGMLLPDFATWLTTGSEVVFDGEGFSGIATHVGFGLGIDFVRDVAPTIAGWLFTADAFAGVMQFTVQVAVQMMVSGYGFIVGLASLVFVPVVCVAGMTAFLLGGSAVSLTQVELRYTVLASPRGFEGNAGLVVGVGI